MMLDLDDARWRAFVDQSADATPFHHPAWARLLALTYRYDGFAIAVVDGSGRVVAGAPLIEVRDFSFRRAWISLPYTDECPPLANDFRSRRELFHALGRVDERFNAPRIEVRGVIGACGWRTATDAVISELELEVDTERVRGRLNRSTRHNIARAQRDGVVVRRATDAKDLDAFYALHTRTRRRQGVPVQPRRFFSLLWSQLVERGLAFILLADAGERKAVAGALFLASYGTTVYKFGASDADSWRLRPNHLILWTAIEDACARGDRRFDFGRTDLSNSGLRTFKGRWGAEERPLRYSTRASATTATNGLPSRVTTRTERLASRAASLAIRKGPIWICRATGEALYRHAASR